LSIDLNSIKKHIEQHLKNVIQNPEKRFDQIFLAIDEKAKQEIKNLLIYLDKILNHSITPENNEFKYTHIHIEGLDEEHTKIIAAYLSIKFFLKALEEDETKALNKNITEIILKIDKKLNNTRIESGIKGNSRKYKKILTHKKKLRDQKEFYNYIHKNYPTASFNPRVIINLLTRDKSYLSELFLLKKYAISDIENPASYVILNTDSLAKLKSLSIQGDKLLKQITSVILFDCESRLDYRGFNFSGLKKLNLKGGASFRNLIIISTNKSQHSFNNLKNRIGTIESRFFKASKYPNHQTYIIPIEETRKLLKKDSNQESIFHFFGEHRPIFWENFMSLVHSYSGLEELTSIKMMNIYSLAFNDAIRNIILDKIFSENDAPLLTQTTKETLELDLSHDSRLELKEALSNTLDWIIQNNWLAFIKEKINEHTTLIISPTVKNDIKLKKEISGVLGVSVNRMKSWFENIRVQSMNLLILNYRDRGRFPFAITPNLFRNQFQDANSILGLFLTFFFKEKYEWNNYKFNFEYLRIQKHVFRDVFFNWQSLESTVRKSRPVTKELIYKWDEENSYQDRNELTYYKVFLSINKKHSTHFPSELFIYTLNDDSPPYRIARIDELIEFSEKLILIQKLESFYKTLNLAEISVDLKKEEKELQLIKAKYDIEQENSPGSLWKTLLQRKHTQNKELYKILKKDFEDKGLKLVSEHRFLTTWANPESEILIPRGRKSFLTLCNSLELPKTYYLIMRRIKNASKSNERTRTMINNKMFSLLFNDGCFDTPNSARTIIQEKLNSYKSEIDFEDLGLTVDKIIIDELESLVQLLSESLNLKKLKKIETGNND